MLMLAGSCWGFILKVEGKQICIRYLWLEVWRFRSSAERQSGGGGGGDLIGAERVSVADLVLVVGPVMLTLEQTDAATGCA